VVESNIYEWASREVLFFKLTSLVAFPVTIVLVYESIKINIPITQVNICESRELLTLFPIHFSRAKILPDLYISAAPAPINIIKNKNLAFQGLLITSTIQRKESVVAAMGFQLETISAPAQTPANKETITCLVYIAKIIAKIGGITDNMPKVSPEINIYLLIFLYTRIFPETIKHY
jgi:hypothetical protein